MKQNQHFWSNEINNFDQPKSAFLIEQNQHF
jgi:hypothetical protein